MAEPDFSKYADPIEKSAAGGSPDFSKYADPVGVPKTTLGQQGMAALETGGRSALQGAGVLAGAGSGATAGAMLGPAGALAGGLIGGALGYQAGDMAAQGGFGLRSAQQLPPELRTGGVFGEAVGGALPFALAPYAAAGMGLRATERGVGEIGYSGAGSAVGGLLNSIVDTVRRRPLLTGAAEISSATSAGSAAAVAETVRPGDEGFRTGLETVAGAANPVSLSLALTGKAIGTARSAVTRFSPAAQQTEAAKSLQQILAVTGEDPEMLARALRASGAKSELTGLTAAQRTGSPALAALEQHLGRINKQFGAEAANSAREGLDGTRMLITQLQNTGDPAALAAAGELRGDYYRTLLTQSVEVAKAEALAKAGRVGRGLTTANREQIGRDAYDALDTSLTSARAVEKELWGKVDGTQRVGTSNLTESYNRIVAETLPELRSKKMPTVVRDFLTRVGKPQEGAFEYDPTTMSVRPMDDKPAGTNTDEMRKLRSALLDMTRAASRDPDQAGMERIYSDLAEAALKDMDDALGTDPKNAYNEARTFTREMHNVFTRSFVGRNTSTGKYGDRVAPEILLQKALASGKQAGDLQLRDLEEATRFLPNQGFADDSAYRTMLSAQDQILRIAASDAIDPATGVAKPEKVAKFVKDNAELMRRFPEVEADLRASVKSADRLGALTNRAKGVQDILDKQGAFGVAMGSAGRNATTRAEAAIRAADRVLVSPNQDAELDRLVRIAQGGAAGRAGRLNDLMAARGTGGNARIELLDEKKATEGLSRALVNSALNKATAPDGALDIAKFRDMMTRPVDRGQKPLLTLMQEKGLIDKAGADRMQELFRTADNIGEARNPRTAVQVNESVSGKVMTMLARVAGSKLAGVAQAASGGGGGSSIIVHGAAARFADEFMNKLPIQSANKALTEAMFDPEKMALLLTKMDDTPESARAARRVNAWLVQSGLLSDPETEDRRSQR